MGNKATEIIRELVNPQVFLNLDIIAVILFLILVTITYLIMVNLEQDDHKCVYFDDSEDYMCSLKEEIGLTIPEAQKQLNRNNAEKIIHMSKQRLMKLPECDHTHIILAMSFFYLKQYTKAMYHYEQAYRLNPFNYRIFSYEINTLEDLLNRPLNQYIQYKSDSFNRSRLLKLLKNGKIGTVINICKKRLYDNPKCPEVHYMLGYAYCTIHDLKMAEHHYRLSSKNDPEFLFLKGEDIDVLQSILFKTSNTSMNEDQTKKPKLYLVKK